jgi:hypothetical protein
MCVCVGRLWHALKVVTDDDGVVECMLHVCCISICRFMDNDGICGEQTPVRLEENSESEGDLRSPDLSVSVCLTIFGSNGQTDGQTP